MGVKYFEYKKFMNVEADESEYERAEDDIHFKMLFIFKIKKCYSMNNNNE